MQMFCFFRSRGRQDFDVCDYHGENNQSRNSPHGHVSQQLYQLVPAGTSNSPVHQTADPRLTQNTKGLLFGFKEPDLRRLLPLVEKEDICGSHKSHDPDQPAHVTRPRPQLSQHQPDHTNPCRPLMFVTADLNYIEVT